MNIKPIRQTNSKGFIFSINMHSWYKQLMQISEEKETPFYAYIQEKISTNVGFLRKELHSNVKIHYAVKASPNINIIKEIIASGANGTDCVSGGEIERSIRAGLNGANIVMSGVGKIDKDIIFAIKNELKAINVESEQELILINEMAQKLGKKVKVCLRINPQVAAKTMKSIATGTSDGKFGIDIGLIPKLLSINFENVKIVGISCHIGSQISQMEDFQAEHEALLSFLQQYWTGEIDIINVGGGLAVIDAENQSKMLKNYCNIINDFNHKIQQKYSAEVIIEPGRSLIANAGILITKVLFIKQNGDKNIAIVDAGMNDFMRPALYGIVPEIEPIIKRDGKEIQYKIVGPVCESTCIFCEKITSELQRGDTLMILNTGAYGISMASEYNSRPTLEEILITADKFIVIKRRNTMERILELEGC